VDGRMTMPLTLSNPKTFLPLLLFIGFVFSLMGLGWERITTDSSVYSLGIVLIVVSSFFG